MTNWDPLIQAAALIITTVLVPWGIMAYKARTGVQVSAQQVAAINGAVDTAAGLVQTAIDQGRMKASDLDRDHPLILQEAAAAIARVPNSAAAQDATLHTVAAMIASRVMAPK